MTPTRRGWAGLAIAALLTVTGGLWIGGGVGQGPMHRHVVLVAPDRLQAQEWAQPTAGTPTVPAPVTTIVPAIVSVIDRPRSAPPTADHQLPAPPSISASAIDRVLTQYRSPAQGSGALFYDLGVQYGIDPAYALAFYIQESSAGTKGVARFTHSIGNIRTTLGYQNYEGYRSYDSYAVGIEDWYKLIKALYVEQWQLTTPSAICVRYAPWSDGNNPAVYAANVSTLVDSWQP